MSWQDHEVLVVDASVAAKWYLPEEQSEEAASVLEAGGGGEVALFSPSFLCFGFNYE